MDAKKDIVIVGAGIAGLAAAKLLKKAGKSVTILEKEEKIGGRIKTDTHEGFLLDHGFQVLLTAYPELKNHLDLKRLDLKPFVPGALLFDQAKKTRFVDPLRRKSALFETLFSDAASLSDKWKIFQLSISLKRQTLDSIFRKEEIPTLDYLQQMGFSPKVIAYFFRPFLSGIFLESQLATSSRMFEFVYKMFTEGEATLPAKGMQAIPDQLAEEFHPSEINTLTQVKALEGNTLYTEKGETIEAEHIILACPFQKFFQPQALEKDMPATTNLYFAAEKSPLKEGILALNTQAHQLSNHLAVLSDVAPNYAPEGKALVSVSLLGTHPSMKESLMVNSVLEELRTSFPSAPQWRHLKTFSIGQALPSQISVNDNPDPTIMFPNEQLTICGDALMNGSIHAALKSGRLAAERILQL
jgi:phytoene dehydrogenase-like protein